MRNTLMQEVDATALVVHFRERLGIPDEDFADPLSMRCLSCVLKKDSWLATLQECLESAQVDLGLFCKNINAEGFSQNVNRGNGHFSVKNNMLRLNGEHKHVTLLDVYLAFDL